MEEQQTPKYTNFEALRAFAADDDNAFTFDESISFGKNVHNFIAAQFCLPYARLQVPIIAGYFLMPSQLTSTVPIILLEGKEGTGKTDLMIFGSGFYNVQIQNAAWTYAALRNTITEKRNGTIEISESNFMLFLDNLNLETLNNENLYTLLLSGYSRKASVVKIAATHGRTLDFDTYCPKVCSTVHNLLGDSKYRELRRRCLIIRTKSWNEVTSKDEVSPTFNPDDYQSLDGLNFSEFKFTYDKFWNDTTNRASYLSTKKRLNKSLKGVLPLKNLLLDLVTTMIVTSVSSEQEAISCLQEFLEWQQDTQIDNALVDCIKQFIAKENEPYAEIGIEIKEISPKRLKDAIGFYASEGALDCIATPSLIASVMSSLSWSLKNGKWRKTT